MVKRINEAFKDEDHQALKEAKQKKAEELGLSKMSWEKYLLHISGVRRVPGEKNYHEGLFNLDILDSKEKELFIRTYEAMVIKNPKGLPDISKIVTA